MTTDPPCKVQGATCACSVLGATCGAVLSRKATKVLLVLSATQKSDPPRTTAEYRCVASDSEGPAPVLPLQVRCSLMSRPRARQDEISKGRNQRAGCAIVRETCN
jgi:hypothetical protein